MAKADWSRKTSDVPAHARRQWLADRAFRPPMRSPRRVRDRIGSPNVVLVTSVVQLRNADRCASSATVWLANSRGPDAHESVPHRINPDRAGRLRVSIETRARSC